MKTEQRKAACELLAVGVDGFVWVEKHVLYLLYSFLETGENCGMFENIGKRGLLFKVECIVWLQ